MDLLVKSIIAVIVIIVIIAVIYYAFKNVTFGQQVTENEATALVIRDLQNSNNNAIVNVTNVTQSQYVGSWHILASVIFNATSPCPTYEIYSFDYPKYAFVYRVENVYTNNCVIYGSQSKNGSAMIGSWPAAITKSYDLNIPGIMNFVNTYGYSNVLVYANYYNSTSISGQNYTGVWIVKYSSSYANKFVYVVLSQSNGTALLSYNLTK